MTTLVGNLTDLLEPTISALGYQLWGVEYLPSSKHSTLRLFIDSDSGVDIDDCAAVSRQVSGILDVEDPIPGEYNLEVSSPGVDRPLFKEAHYQQYCGQWVKLKLSSAIEGRRNFTGRIVEVKDGGVKLLLGEGPEATSGQLAKTAVNSQKQAVSQTPLVDANDSEATCITIGLWQVNRGRLMI